MTPKEMIEILQAYERGEEIEVKSSYRDWTILGFKYPTIYCFNFQDLDYRIKKKRWRAEKDQAYYFIGSFWDVCEGLDSYCHCDNIRFKAGNYFRTKEKAEKARDMMEEYLTKFNEENN